MLSCPIQQNNQYNGMSFKATIVNEQDIQSCLALLKRKEYHPANFIPDYYDKQMNLEDKKLITFLKKSEKIKNKLCTDLYKKLSTKVQEIKSWGDNDDLVYIGSSNGKTASVELSNPKLDNNVFSPSGTTIFQTDTPYMTNNKENYVDSVLNVNTKTLDKLKTFHQNRIDEFKEKYGDPHYYPEYLWQIDGDNLV